MSVYSDIRRDFSNQRKTLADRAKKVAAIKPRLLRFQKDMKASVDKGFSVSAFFDGDDVCVMYYVRYIDSFKDERLMKLLGRLLELGPLTNETIDYADYLNREYRLSFIGGVRVVVTAYVASGSGLCRKVLKNVESRVTEYKTYEMVCE